ncbi:hypothetical protein GW587_06250 [Duganella sp. SAP-35]|uniref:citrate synthase (unknown stereospecificity) n=2 Tax=Duganella aceris TaxID=2703883 RepID=A0ABX0FH23_9BURK|nr:hypothetical protein [Duganella aceris]
MTGQPATSDSDGGPGGGSSGGSNGGPGGGSSGGSNGGPGGGGSDGGLGGGGSDGDGDGSGPGGSGSDGGGDGSGHGGSGSDGGGGGGGSGHGGSGDGGSSGSAPGDSGSGGSGGLDDGGEALRGGGKLNGGIHVRLARAWRCDAAEDLIRRTLVLLADHELNASTFATRVAVSTGASLSAGVLAGFATLTGPLHGGASAELAQLRTLADQIGPSDAVRQWLASDRPLPAFGHPLYPDGDPRARALLKLLPELQPYHDLAIAAEAQAGELPNIDYALSLLAAACGLPRDAPFILFAVGRCVGWLAHALEQVQANRLIRPRARYIGPA